MDNTCAKYTETETIQSRLAWPLGTGTDRGMIFSLLEEERGRREREKKRKFIRLRIAVLIHYVLRLE